ncbi:polyisoprenoid-binding protein YceI [Pedobacter cryoconitis]|uniref:Polyisoprenoid-binding protein YceI n=1 Tax=Pedobacter cryoconitis TaxID=188932 RepID=A0A7W8YYP0_9SPHI|nr:YceI family protein [Pedobacter cryoconitis]MBB5624267.1 polyisoprenoid-binding protein YceI [Pedobacter cryoconitis]MBB5647303.1 polyisoprenoid-binding protein YceI [Pedobacter cryoconitis]
METKKFKVITTQSSIGWTGKKVTGAHHGTISINDGTLILDDNKLSGGSFVIDTTSIKILDITDPDTNAQFAGHLFSEDFFATESFPEALFTLTNSEYISSLNYVLTGNLTIKGITHSVEFPATVLVTADEINASGKIIIDRTKYNMKFRSGNFFTNLGDTLIYNEFDLDVKLTASATL